MRLVSARVSHLRCRHALLRHPGARRRQRPVGEKPRCSPAQQGLPHGCGRSRKLGQAPLVARLRDSSRGAVVVWEGGGVQRGRGARNQLATQHRCHSGGCASLPLERAATNALAIGDAVVANQGVVDTMICPAKEGSVRDSVPGREGMRGKMREIDRVTCKRGVSVCGRKRDGRVGGARCSERGRCGGCTLFHMRTRAPSPG